MNRNLIFLSSLLLLQIPIPIKAAPASIAQNSICRIEREEEFYSTKQLQTLANKITVKIIGDRNGGSGTLIGKQGNNYLVLTNSHVIQGVNSITLQTADGKTYSAEIVPQNKFKKSDITLLKFQSSQSYCLSEIAKTTPEINTPVVAAGFSGSTGNIIFSEGEVKKTSNLKEGYEIGYSSNIEQGMSGGAILNSMGELVGINGKSAYPILNSGYVYQNGKRPNQAEIREMRKLSWGIPISTVLTWVDGDVLTAYKLPFPEGKNTILEPDYPKWVKDLEQKAKQFTVRIDSSSNANGSGIIIAREGNNYTVLTSAHVLCERVDATKPCGGFNYEILAPDGNKYSVDKSSIKIEEGVDLAVVKFKSSGDYQIATLANYNPNEDDYMFTAGYPKLGNDSPWRFTVGQITSKEEGLLLVKDSDFSRSGVGSLGSKGINSLTGGYELVYTSITYGGMSGGPVLNSQGRVIGIHGRAEGEEAYDSKTGDCGGSGSKCQIQIGFSLGIPVSTFLGLVPRLGVKPQNLENNRPPQLNPQQIESIKKAALTAEVSGGNATADKWLERGNQLLRLGRYEEADKAFDEVIKRKSSFAYLAYFGKGLNFSSQEKYKESVETFEQAVKLKPDYVGAWRILSFMYMNIEQYDKALIAANKTILLQPKNPSGYFVKGTTLIYLQRYTEAQATMTEAIKLNPSAINYSWRGIMYMAQKKWDLAKADFDKAIELNPKSDDAYQLRGRLYVEQQKWDLAIADYSKWIQLKPKNFEPYFKRANSYRSQEKWDLALADYNKVIKLNPKSDKIYAYRGLIYLEQQKWDLAMADIKKAIKFGFDYYDPFSYVSRELKIEKQQFNSAIAYYNKIIKLEPQDIEAYFNRALIYVIQEKMDLAKANLDEILKLDPQNVRAYIYRGHIYNKRYKSELALADYNKAIQLNPQNGEAYAYRGFMYEKLKDKNKAVQDYYKAAQLFKAQGQTTSYSYANILLQSIQKDIQKKKQLDLAIQSNPDNSEAYYNRAKYYDERYQYNLALADWSKVIELNPHNTEAYLKRATIYNSQKQKDLAIPDLSKVIELEPENLIAYSYRAQIYKEQEKWDLAIADYSKIIELDSSNYPASNYISRANSYRKQKKYNLALADYSKAIEINPNNADFYYYQRGLTLIKLGNKQKAIQELQKAAELSKAQGHTYVYKDVMNELHKLQN